MTASIIQLNAHPAFVASLDVYVDAIAFALNVPIEFGPFNSKEEAFRWVEEVESLHATRDKGPKLIEGELFDEEGLARNPYIDFHLSVPQIFEHKLARKEAARLFPPERAEIAEAKMPEYAIIVTNERTGYARHLLEQQKKK